MHEHQEKLSENYLIFSFYFTLVTDYGNRIEYLEKSSLNRGQRKFISISVDRSVSGFFLLHFRSVADEHVSQLNSKSHVSQLNSKCSFGTRNQRMWKNALKVILLSTPSVSWSVIFTMC